MSKVWAGSWYIAVQKGSADGEREIEVRDVENDTLDVVGCVSVREGEGGSCKMELRLPTAFKVMESFSSYSKTGELFFDIGSFHIVWCGNRRFRISGGSKDDSLYIGNADVLIKDKLTASIFCMTCCGAVENLSEISADAIVVDRCQRFCTYELSSDVLCLSNVYVENRRKITVKQVINHRNTAKIVNNWGGVITIEASMYCALLRGVDDSCSCGTMCSDKGWLTYTDDAIPFLGAKGGVDLRLDGNGTSVRFNNVECYWYCFCFFPTSSGMNHDMESCPRLKIVDSKDGIRSKAVAYLPVTHGGYIGTCFACKFFLDQKDPDCRFKMDRAYNSKGGSVVLRSGFDETVVYLLPKKQTVK